MGFCVIYLFRFDAPRQQCHFGRRKKQIRLCDRGKKRKGNENILNNNSNINN